jgi:hypothetical protein
MEKKVKLSKLKLNPKNPRRISEAKMNALIDSILIFPKMLALRPIVVDGLVALGGNQRTKALKEIAKMSVETIRERLEAKKAWERMTDEQKTEHLDYWDSWLKIKEVIIKDADTLTEEEKDEFTAKDNVQFGDWDLEELDKWDTDLLEDWSVDLPYKPEEIDIDDFFEEMDGINGKNDKVKIILELPSDLKDKKEDLIEQIKITLADYKGIIYS